MRGKGLFAMQDNPYELTPLGRTDLSHRRPTNLPGFLFGLRPITPSTGARTNGRATRR